MFFFWGEGFELPNYRIDVAEWVGWMIRWTKQRKDTVNLFPGKCQYVMDWHERILTKQKKKKKKKKRWGGKRLNQ